MVWTQFWDMHSGGGTKVEPYEMIYIEAPKEEAKVIFYNRFKRNPERVTCTCCGEDYSISEYPSLAEATKYHREDYLKDDEGNYEKEPPGKYGYREPKQYERYTVEEYISKPDVLAITALEIQPNERVGEVPSEGYVWQ